MPSIDYLLSTCKQESYKGMLVCKLLESYMNKDRDKAIELVREVLNRIKELLNNAKNNDSNTPSKNNKTTREIPRIVFVSAGPSKHWRDSFKYASRHGLVPWACGFNLEKSIIKSPRYNGPNYKTLLDSLARGFILENNSFEALLPIIVYYSSGIGVIGFGLALWADVSPLRTRLWSEESCPPSENGICYTIRWYTLPLALGCKVIDNQAVIEPSEDCAIKEIDVGNANMNCAQSLQKNIQSTY